MKITDRFYNTINLEGKELSVAEQAALSQEQRILRFMIGCRQGYSVAPSAMRDSVFDNSVPLTSVRRAMTSLTRRGDLIKLCSMIRGPYGKPEHLWTVAAKWNTNTPIQGELL